MLCSPKSKNFQVTECHLLFPNLNQISNLPNILIEFILYFYNSIFSVIFTIFITKQITLGNARQRFSTYLRIFYNLILLQFFEKFIYSMYTYIHTYMHNFFRIRAQVNHERNISTQIKFVRLKICTNHGHSNIIISIGIAPM